MILEAERPHRPARAPARSRREPLPAWAGGEALVTAREAAALRRCSVATIWRDVKSGRLAAPLYLGAKRPRWRLCDVSATVAARAAATTAAE